MITASWPDHLLTLTEWDALPEDTSRRCESVEGVLPAPVKLDLDRLTSR